MKMRYIASGIAGIMMAAAAGASSAAVLDFDTVGDCSGGDIVTISTLGSATCSVSASPEGSDSLLLQTPGTFSQARADFSSLVSSVSVDLGDFAPSDSDNVFLEIFDSGDSSLGYVDFLRPGSSDEMNTLSLSAAGIAYAVFGTNGDDIGAIFADNLSYETSAIPLPAGGVLLIGALGALGLARRKRSA
ncbi:hypothetical protein Ga0609869_001607 [Rhodovulum iodosum]|uniref:VPLPA-CTERM sorting domain-containing protein n=1 Tax=Rhodovulum iodosum TaxID=68291 RepID=A0ABV3XT59_9RHOB|nr:VPLPA-CTERM sorting domain-containing protein [Rhodovulum robiginosum]